MLAPTRSVGTHARAVGRACVAANVSGYDAVMDEKNNDGVPTAAEVAGYVTAQHGMIRSAFHAAKTGSEEHQQAATRRLLQLLAMHEAAEQLTVHPALAHAGTGPVGVGEDRMAEEEQAVQLAERLQHFEYGSYEYKMQLALLEEAVTHHATSEETAELPLFENLTATERLTIGQALRAVGNAVDGQCPIEYADFSTMLRDSKTWLAG